LLIARLIADPATVETRLDAAIAALASRGLPVADAQVLDAGSDVLQIDVAGDDWVALREELDAISHPPTR
jgi:phosphoserine phosphatase